MKLVFEKILPSDNTSWRYWLYEQEEIGFHWHYHPEYEIALILNSKGQRYVGDNIDTYDEFDMAFIGPNLPHTWCSSPAVNGEKQQTYVAQIPKAWLESLVYGMPDLSALKNLLALSQRGIKFSQPAVIQAAHVFANLADADATKRFVGLMDLLQIMNNDQNKQLLASSGFKVTTFADPSTDKLNKAVRYIHEHYTSPISAKDIAQLLHMSTNHFHRFFKHHTEQTFTEFVNQLRISKACSLLINTRKPIYTISDTCGFNNISNFNRRFLQFKAMKPSEFRKIYAGKVASTA